MKRPSQRDRFLAGVVTVNPPPVANAGPDLSVASGQKFVLSGAGSGDADGAVTGWRWDVQGSEKVLQGARELSFDKPGIHTLTLTVTDNSSAINRTAQDEVAVRSIIDRWPRPVATSSATGCASCWMPALRPMPTMTVSPIIGISATAPGAGAVVEHTYATGGIYPVMLWVETGAGLPIRATTMR